MVRVLGAALAELHGDELVALEDLLADEVRLELRRGDLGTQTRGLTLVGHDDAGHRVHVLLEGHIAPDRTPEAHARHGNHHAAVLGLEEGELAGLVGARQVVEQREDVLALLVHDVGVDHLVVLDALDELLGRNALFDSVTGIERQQDRLLLLVEFVLGLPLLESECGQRQQRRNNDDHHRRIDDDVGVAVGIESLPGGLLLRELRGGNAANGAGIRCGGTLVDVSADIAFELFLCHIYLPYFAVLTRFLRREMFASTT